MISRTRICISLAALGLATLGGSVRTSELAPQDSSTPQTSGSTAVPFGAPLPGLTTTLGAAFAAGLAEFQDEDTAASGLGPIFNDVSCVAWHSTPAPGGASAIMETRFGRLINGQFDPLTALGGSLLQSKAIDPAVQEVIPAQANIIAKRMTTPLFGAGLVEAIPESTILFNAFIWRPDGIAQAAAAPQEMRTAPLWGLRVRAPYLHDGRAATVDAAIVLHDGEAAITRNRYNALSGAQKQQLLQFLGSI